MTSITIDREGFLANILLAQKGPCRVATTASITLSGIQTIDGVTVEAEDRVLVKDQSNGFNAIYIVKSSDWELAQDFDQRGHVVQGTWVFVNSGTVNALTTWYVTTAGRPYPGREAIAFAQLSASEISGLTPSDGAFIVGNGSTWVAESGATAQVSLGVRENLTSDRTYYLRADGSDANTGLANTAAGAWRTPQHAMDTFAESLDLAGYNITVQLGAGTYEALYAKILTGGSYVFWTGDETTPTNVKIKQTNSLAGPVLDIEPEGVGIHIFRGIQFENDSGAASGERRVVYVGRRSRAEFRNCNYVTNTTDTRVFFVDEHSFATIDGTTVITTTNAGADYQLYANYGFLSVAGTLTVNGLNGCLGHMYAQLGGRIHYYPSAVTVDGTPTIGFAFAVAEHGALIESSGTTFTATVSGGYRAVASRGSVIDVFGGGLNYFPGGSDPFVEAGGLYRYANGTLAPLELAPAKVVAGGNSADATLKLRSTIGNGTSDAIIFQVGNNGATEAARVATGGNVIFGHTAVSTGISATTSLFALHTTASASRNVHLFRWTNDTGGAQIHCMKSRGTSPSSHAIVQSGDAVALFRGMGSDGTNFVEAGRINIDVDGTPGSSDMPGRITFFTTPDGSASATERMRIDQAGNVVAPKLTAALSTGATDGLIHIPTSTSGSTSAPIGTPTTYTGSAPMVYATGSNRLWVYNGAWRSVALSS